MNEATILSYTDYRAFLRDELSRRQARNARYSLRSFARDLGLAPPRLSDILRGRYGLSGAAAAELAARLRMSEEESFHFRDLAEAEHGRSRLARENARLRLKRAVIQEGPISVTWNGSPEELARELETKLKERGLSGARLEIRARPLE